MKGKAAVATGVGVPMEIREYPLPEVEPEAILVKITMATICGSDVHAVKGEYKGRPEFAGSPSSPKVLGHEMTGIVYKLGKNLKTDYLGQPLKEGDRIVYCYFRRCGKCWACQTGRAQCPNRLDFRRGSCEESPHFQGAYAEYYYLVPGQWVYKVPDELSDEMVAPMNCALSTVAFGLHKAGINFEDRVVIQGAGGLGISSIAVAKDMGAAQIIVIDKVEERLKLAKEFGADVLINVSDYPTPEARVGKVKELTKGIGAELVVEVVGYPEVMPEGIDMLNPGGTYLLMGNVMGGYTCTIDPEKLIHGCKRIIGSGNYEAWVIPKLLDFMARTKDKYPFHKIVSHKFKLEDINEAFKQAAAHKVTRAAILP